MKTKRSFLASLLVLCMVLTLLPMEAFAKGSSATASVVTAGCVLGEGHADDCMTELKLDSGDDWRGNGSPASVASSEEISESPQTWLDFKAAYFESGDGSAEAPFQIASAEQLALLSYLFSENNDEVLSTYRYRYYDLVADIDLSGHNWIPIGGYRSFFAGNFNGNDYTISNIAVTLTHNNPNPSGDLTDYNSCGLFGKITASTIENLVLDTVNINADADHEIARLPDTCGALVGCIYQPAKAYVEEHGAGARTHVSNVHVTNLTLNGGALVGGLAGYTSYATIDNCSVKNATIKSQTCLNNYSVAGTGGIVGCIRAMVKVQDSVCEGVSIECIAPSDSNLDVKYSALGGIVGEIGFGGIDFSYGLDDIVSEIVRCSADVRIAGSGICRSGGLLGSAHINGNNMPVSISDSVATIQAVGSGSFGGITATANGIEGKPFTMENCFASGTFHSNMIEWWSFEGVGQLVGSMKGYSSIRNCYSNVAVTIDDYRTHPSLDPETISRNGIGYVSGNSKVSDVAVVKSKALGDLKEADILLLDPAVDYSVVYSRAPIDGKMFLDWDAPSNITFLFSEDEEAWTKISPSAAGRYYLKIISTINENEVALATMNVTIAPHDISGTAEIIGIASHYKHTGQPITPEVAVMDGGILLESGNDYVVEYSDNTDEGQATITVKFKGNYTGSRAVHFDIRAALLPVVINHFAGEYDGLAHGIKVSVPPSVAVSFSATEGGVYAEIPITFSDVGSNVVWYKAEQAETIVTGAALVTITPAPLTITAEDKEMIVNGSLPEFTYTVSGLCGEDALASPSLTCETNGKIEGKYPIVSSGADAGKNYSIIYVNGMLTVSHQPTYPGPGRPTATVSGGNGKLTFSGSTITITPDEWYQIAQITVNGKKVDIPTDGKLTKLKPTDKVIVTFEVIDAKVLAPFADLPEDGWANKPIAYAVRKGIFKGIDSTTFAPDAPMSRAMLWISLARMSGLDTVGGKTWYSVAQSWVEEKDISDGLNPDNTITREQLATTLYRLAGSPAVSGMALNEFGDGMKVSVWATDAMLWAVENKIFTGKGDGILDPQANTTRAEVAAMLMCYSERVSA